MLSAGQAVVGRFEKMPDVLIFRQPACRSPRPKDSRHDLVCRTRVKAMSERAADD
jgi:hypothetical protein